MGTKGFGYKGSKIFRALPNNHVVAGDFEHVNTKIKIYGWVIQFIQFENFRLKSIFDSKVEITEVFFLAEVKC